MTEVQAFIFGMCVGAGLMGFIGASLPSTCQWCKRRIPPKLDINPPHG